MAWSLCPNVVMELYYVNMRIMDDVDYFVVKTC
jgi:hypothetical protein